MFTCFPALSFLSNIGLRSQDWLHKEGMMTWSIGMHEGGVALAWYRSLPRSGSLGSALVYGICLCSFLVLENIKQLWFISKIAVMPENLIVIFFFKLKQATAFWYILDQPCSTPGQPDDVGYLHHHPLLVKAYVNSYKEPQYSKGDNHRVRCQPHLATFRRVPL